MIPSLTDIQSFSRCKEFKMSASSTKSIQSSLACSKAFFKIVENVVITLSYIAIKHLVHRVRCFRQAWWRDLETGLVLFSIIYHYEESFYLELLDGESTLHETGVSTRLNVYGGVALLCLGVTIVFAVISIRNFGKGLKECLKRKGNRVPMSFEGGSEAFGSGNPVPLVPRKFDID